MEEELQFLIAEGHRIEFYSFNSEVIIRAHYSGDKSYRYYTYQVYLPLKDFTTRDALGNALKLLRHTIYTTRDQYARVSHDLLT